MTGRGGGLLVLPSSMSMTVGAVMPRQLGSYTGTIQLDGYDAYQALARSGSTRERISLAFCLAHARRKFVDAWRKSPSPLAERITAAIGEVFAVEGRIKGLTAQERQRVRKLESSAPMALIKAEIDEMLPHLSPKSNLAKAMRYTLAHWQGLNRFIEDGRLEVDINTVERDMRSMPKGASRACLQEVMAAPRPGRSSPRFCRLLVSMALILTRG